MSRTFNMVGGGGGNVATLAVAVTNGTATSVTAAKSGVSVSLTYSGGIWSAELPSFGTWTVTITDGTHSNTATVSATQAGLYSATIYMPDVPSEYTQLEYIESTGTQYINTGLVISGGGQIKTKFAWPFGSQPAQNNAVLGLQVPSPYNNVLLRYQSPSSNEVIYATYGLTARTQFQAGLVYDIQALFDSTNKALTAIINGTMTQLTSGSRIIASIPLFLFALDNNGNAQNFSSIVMYTFEYTAANAASPTAKYVPAKRNSDSVLGMYDTATNTFKTNAGTGTFTAGPAV